MAGVLSSSLAFSTGFQRISTALVWLMLLVCVDAQNRSTAEVETLLRFKQMTQDDLDSTLSRGYWNTWNETDKSPCAWYGILCTDNFTVQQVDLSTWGLTKLPSVGVLSNLTDLSQLILWGNRWGKGGAPVSIPDDIGTLVGLTSLDLSKNNFSGPIPASVSACRRLRLFTVEGNFLSGEVPDLSGMVNLQDLRLQQNQLSGPFPPWLGGLGSPLYVDMSVNMFSGTIPSLSNLTNLLELVLDNNSFTGFEGAFFPNAKSLEELSVKFNQLEGPIPPNVTNLLNLRTLDLSSNQLSGSIPPGFSLNMSQVIRIDLSHNKLMGSIPESFLQPVVAMTINPPSLKISDNLLTGHLPFDGTKRYNYKAIDFSHNNLTGPLPSICKNGASAIGQLWLQNNQLSGDIVEFLAECYAHIQDLRLANNSFSGDLSRLENVNTTLDLVGRESNLQKVDLSNNNLQISTSEANPDPLRAILEFFVLNTSIVEFRMQGNNFSGISLPAYFASSANSLQVLDLSNNHLEGGVSGAAFNDTWLPALQFLNLSNNVLSGPLPAQLPDRLYNPSFFAGNSRLCGGPLTACSHGIGFRWWILLIAFGGSLIIILGSCVVITWRWRVYRKLHQQDADLIRTLLEKESAALMSLRELKKATNNFSVSAQIGEGGFGTVYRGKLNDETIVAIKRSKREGSETDKEKFLNEVRVLSQVNHRHLVKLLGCCMENRIALLVFEFVPNGTLQEHLQGRRHSGENTLGGEIGAKSLSWKRRLHIAVQTADAIHYLHSGSSFPIYHRDVKSSNILLDDDLNAKVADFGISKLAPLEATHVSTIAIQGTMGYVDPEYYTSYQLTDKSDVYSFGVVLLELISGKPAVDFRRGEEKTSLVNFANIHMENGDFRHFLDEALRETYNDLAGHGRESILRVARLAMTCLHTRSKARPSMYEVWKELRDMWLAFQGTSRDLGSVTDDDKNQDLLSDSSHDDIILLSDSFNWSNTGSNTRNVSSSYSVHNDSASIQMSQLSRIRSQSS